VTSTSCPTTVRNSIRRSTENEPARLRTGKRRTAAGRREPWRPRIASCHDAYEAVDLYGELRLHQLLLSVGQTKTGEYATSTFGDASRASGFLACLGCHGLVLPFSVVTFCFCEPLPDATRKPHPEAVPICEHNLPFRSFLSVFICVHPWPHYSFCLDGPEHFAGSFAPNMQR
jgi:hypothetical protein